MKQLSSRSSKQARRLRLESLERRDLLALSTAIQGFVFHDLNRDGNSGDLGTNHVADIEVNLLDAEQNIVATADSDPNGSFLLETTAPGIYTISLELPEGIVLGPLGLSGDPIGNDVDPATGKSAPFEVTGGELFHFAAGVYSADGTGAIEGFVWDDLNANGIQDSGEPGISNVEVQLENIYYPGFPIWVEPGTAPSLNRSLS